MYSLASLTLVAGVEETCSACQVMEDDVNRQFTRLLLYIKLALLGLLASNQRKIVLKPKNTSISAVSTTGTMARVCPPKE